MAGWRRAVELAMTGEEIETLTALSRSSTEVASRVERAQMAGGHCGIRSAITDVVRGS